MLLRLEQPTTGLAHAFAVSMGPQVMVFLRLFLYGAQAQAAAEHDGPQWQAWLGEKFPMGG